MEDKHLIVNRFQTPDGTMLVSKYVHDCVFYHDANGDLYMVDGGNEYCRTSVNDVPMINMSVYDTDDIEDIREALTLFGSGDNPDKLLKDCNDDELIGYLVKFSPDYNQRPNKVLFSVVAREIAYRKFNI